MRVLTVGNRYPPDGTGGYERVWRAAVDGLREAGHDVTVLTTEPSASGAAAPDAPVATAATEPGAPFPADPGAPVTTAATQPGAPAAGEPGVHRTLRWYWRDHAFLPLGLRETRALERHNAAELARHDADLVVWFAMGGMSLSLVARVAVPQLAVVHDGWPVYGPGVDRWTARWGRFARVRYDPARVRHWSCNSAFTRDALARAGLPAARMSVESPGVDAPAFPASAPPRWRGELLVLGRIEEGKGVADAIAALPDGMRLTVTGPEDVAHRAQLPPDPRVTFTGPTADPAAALAAADCLLFPVTWAEPWGLVPLEAMAVGRPVIATGTGGSAEYLRDGENALIVPPGDPAALRDAIERLASDAALRTRLVAGGRATSARSSEAAWVAQLVALAERVAAG